MAFLFGGRGRQKAPAEIVKSLKDLLAKLQEPGASTKIEEEAAKHMAQMKLIVQGTPGKQGALEATRRVLTDGRTGQQPRAGLPARHLHNSRRYPVRIGTKHTAATLRSPQRRPNHLLPHPTLQASPKFSQRDNGDQLSRDAEARDHCRVVSRLRGPQKRHALWHHTTAGPAA